MQGTYAETLIRAIVRCGIQVFSRRLEFTKLSANMGHNILKIYDRRT